MKYLQGLSNLKDLATKQNGFVALFILLNLKTKTSEISMSQYIQTRNSVNWMYSYHIQQEIRPCVRYRKEATH